MCIICLSDGLQQFVGSFGRAIACSGRLHAAESPPLPVCRPARHDLMVQLPSTSRLYCVGADPIGGDLPAQ